jgi:uncharacterized protein involved in exopolysaccharide biosynthesis
MNNNDTGGTQISAREVLAIIFRRKVAVLLVAAIVTAVTLTAASRTASVYRATAKVLLRRAGATPLSTTWTPFYSLEEEINTEIQMIRTQFVQDRAVELLKERGVKVHVDVGDSQVIREPSVSDIAGGVSVEPVEMSNIILIKFTGSDPEFVQHVANAVADAYVEQRIRIRQSPGMDEFFQDQLMLLEARILDLKETELGLRKAGEIYDLKWQYQVKLGRRSELQEDLAHIRSRRLAAVERLKMAKQRMREDPHVLVPFSELPENDVINRIWLEYWQLRKERDEQASMLTDSNPQVKMLDNQIALMEDRLREEASRKLRELEYLIDDLTADERGYEAAIFQIDAELRKTPDMVVQIEHLEKEIHFTYLHYDKVLEKMLDTMASEANDIRISNAKVIGRASVTLTQAGKMQTVYVAFSILLGVTLGIGFGFLLENLDHSVRTATDVEETIGVPLLGSVPESRDISQSAGRLGGGGSRDA